MLHLMPHYETCKAIVVGDDGSKVAVCKVEEAGPYLIVTDFRPKISEPEWVERVLQFISRTLKGLAYTSGKTPLFFVNNEYFAEILLDNGFSVPDMRCLVGTFQEKAPEAGTTAPEAKGSDQGTPKSTKKKKKKQPSARRKKK